MPPDPLEGATYAAAAYSSHVGFTHKLGNPLLQILDPSLITLVCGLQWTACIDDIVDLAWLLPSCLPSPVIENIKRILWCPSIFCLDPMQLRSCV